MQEQNFTPSSLDFDQFYRGEARPGGAASMATVKAWDIGEPQPVLVELERTGQVRGDVLDAGCGFGGNVLFLAERGYQVTGFDVSPTALDQARSRAEAAGVAPDFVVADATKLDGFEQRFDTVLDSALYHCLSDEQRVEYAAALHRVTLPGAQLHLLCVAETEPAGMRMPMQVSASNLREHLGAHWDIHAIDLADYTTTFTKEVVTQQSPDELRALGVEIDEATLRMDSAGRILLPVWHLNATRR